MRGKLLIVGFGPGSFEHITKRAREAIEESDVIIGYNTYVDLIRGLLTEKHEIVRTGMTEEVSRAIEAVRQAEMGKKVAVISSGDAGVYGMAGLVYEVLIEKGWREESGVEVEVVPGISAVNSVASLLGAPVMHDYCCISLSDHLTPWELIARRVEAAGMGDFIVALYNPKSGKRTRQIAETQKILLKYRPAETPVGLVKSAYRDRQQIVMTTLGEMLEHDIGMLTTVVIGNSSTFFYDGKMITPRGYQRKYTLGKEEQPLRMNERLQEEHEPWALHGGVKEGKGAGGAGSAGGAGGGVAVVGEAPGEISQGVERVTGRGVMETGPVAVTSSLELAMDAVTRLVERGAIETDVVAKEQVSPYFASMVAILELAVSPGVAEKRISNRQMMAILEVVGDEGEMEYTPNHHLLLRVPTAEPDAVVQKLQAAGLSVQGIGNVVQVKACDFCQGEKAASIPQAELLAERLAGLAVPKELRIGFAGCAMACYGSVVEDIAVVYRRNRFDLFLGGKTIGRNAHAAQQVAEGLDADEIVETIERIVAEYKEKGHPDERFHKFFKRMGVVAGYRHQEVAEPIAVDLVCGD